MGACAGFRRRSDARCDRSRQDACSRDTDGAEHADRSRAEYQTVTLASRLMASAGTELTIDVRGKERRATIVPKPIYKREES